MFFLSALGFRLALGRWLGQLPFVTFFMAVLLSALFCGWRQGLAVLLLSLATGCAFFLPSTWVYRFGDQSFMPVLAFAANSGLTIVFVSALTEMVRRLEAARKVQESLFLELQHRVANNMQFIAAMLHQAKRAMPHSAAAEALDQAAARIASMARLNRQLSDPDTYRRGLRPVLCDMLREMFQDFPVETRVDVRSRPLSLDQMTVVVLLVSEAATNALKHVFRTQQGSLFEVALTEATNGRLRLVIRDDGPGLGPVPTPSPPAQKLGMRIMRALAAQLGGSLQLPEGHGATLLVEFAPG